VPGLAKPPAIAKPTALCTAGDEDSHGNDATVQVDGRGLRLPGKRPNESMRKFVERHFESAMQGRASSANDQTAGRRTTRSASGQKSANRNGKPISGTLHPIRD
jgi:hypothetical protein